MAFFPNLTSRKRETALKARNRSSRSASLIFFRLESVTIYFRGGSAGLVPAAKATAKAMLGVTYQVSGANPNPI